MRFRRGKQLPELRLYACGIFATRPPPFMPSATRPAGFRRRAAERPTGAVPYRVGSARKPGPRRAGVSSASTLDLAARLRASDRDLRNRLARPDALLDIIRS